MERVKVHAKCCGANKAHVEDPRSHGRAFFGLLDNCYLSLHVELDISGLWCSRATVSVANGAPDSLAKFGP